MGLRQDRVAEQIRDILGSYFQGGKMSDPRLQGVVITFVKVSADLQIATIYYRILQADLDKVSVQSAMERAEGYFKRKLAKFLELRRVPQLRFFFDESIESASRIEHLLTQI